MPLKRKKDEEPMKAVVEEPASDVPIAPGIVIARSMELRRIIQIFLNGAHSMLPDSRPFLPHTGFLMTMRQAYERGDAETFVLTVQRYLTEAVGQLPQTGTKEEIPGHVQALQVLIDQAGFALVAQRILSVMNAPL